MSALSPKELSASGWKVFKRAGWKHLLRLMAFIFLVGLNISMPMSLLERFLHHMDIRFGPESMQFLFLLFCNIYFLPSCLFECNWVALKDRELVVSNLLWTRKLSATDIVSTQKPGLLIWMLLRTQRCFYLINRADIENFDELANLIEQRFTE